MRAAGSERRKPSQILQSQLEDLKDLLPASKSSIPDDILKSGSDVLSLELVFQMLLSRRLNITPPCCQQLCSSQSSPTHKMGKEIQQVSFTILNSDTPVF